ncbi:hypothetical protein Cantr_04101 [Candida viswanathii]|uniref:Uncharacterized protein n=1 Tax=Candida viswanathii TaxID=5486 RepID=A0A367XMM8_9ASCO|nr:hypothetical protein Cantr_04101 [Candida viswanathii]
MSLKARTPDAACEEAITRGVVDLIDSKLPKELANLSPKATPDNLQTRINGYEEFLTSIMSLFEEKPLADHQYLWLEAIHRLTSILLKLKIAFRDLYLDLEPHEIEGIASRALPLGTKLMEFTNELGQLVNEFFTNLSKIPIIFQFKAQELILVVLSLLLVDEIEDPNFPNVAATVLELVQLYLLSYRTSVSILVRFSEAVYKLGMSPLIVPLLDEFNPETPMELVSAGGISLVDLMDYYRYTAFNLVSLSIDDDRKYNKLAEVYLRILLRFPNLSVALYCAEEDEKATDGNDKRDRFIINLAERQELSLMYVLNYLLSLNSLRKLIETPPLYRAELKFLVKSLSSCLSKDIDELASRPGSTRSSMVSIPQYTVEVERKIALEKKFLSKSKFSSLGCVILYGSYKEKLKLVVNFGEVFDTPNTRLYTIIEKLTSNNAIESNPVVDKLVIAISTIVSNLNRLK